MWQISNGLTCYAPLCRPGHECATFQPYLNLLRRLYALQRGDQDGTAHRIGNVDRPWCHLSWHTVTLLMALVPLHRVAECHEPALSGQLLQRTRNYHIVREADRRNRGKVGSAES